MVTNDERIKILRMVQDGKITPEEATQLLQALEGSTKTDRSAPAAAPASPAGGARWFRVRVTDSDTGKTRVNIRLPMSVVTSGIKMGMRFAPEVEGLDINTLIEAIRSGETGQIVDVVDEEDGEHVEVFLE